MASKLKDPRKQKRRLISQAQAILKPVGPRYYFAYGSNLCISGMMKRCPDARQVKALQLRGCKLVFRGVADIEITDNDNDWVEGGLWRISTYDEGRLDSYEGVSLRNPEDGLYRKLTFPIGNTKDDTVWDCLIYKMNRKGIMPPSEHYFNIIKKGYADFGLNTDKLNEALAASWDDKDRTPQLNARYDRNGRPPLAIRPRYEAEALVDAVKDKEDREMSVGAVIAEVTHEAEALAASEVTEHFVPPDQWLEGRVAPLVAPERKAVTRNAPAAPPSRPEIEPTPEEGNS